MDIHRADRFEEILGRFEKTQKLYERRSNIFLYMHNIGQLIIFFGATVTAITVYISTISKIIPAVISAIVAFSTALESYYKFKDLSDHYKLSARALAAEQDFYSTHTGSYNSLGEEEARNNFMKQSEEIIDQQIRFSPGSKEGNT